MNHISSYRVFFLPQPYYNPSFIVLAGRTGSGKSAVLQKLSKNGYPVIDLETLAQHSGSAFGNLTFDAPVDSKTFLKRLKGRSEDLKYEPLVFTECKGKALGNLALPEWFLEKMQGGYIVCFDVPVEVRIEHLANAHRNVAPEDFIKAAEKLNGKISAEKLAAATIFLKAHAYKEAIGIFLEYYDNSTTYNYFIDKAHLTVPINNNDPQLMIDKLTTALMEHNPLFLNCG